MPTNSHTGDTSRGVLSSDIDVIFPKIKYQAPEMSNFQRRSLKYQEERALSASSYGLMAQETGRLI